jgi:CSLREA domain-containing protein
MAGMRRLALAAGLIVLAAAPPASATTFPVTTTADTADGTCDAQCSLREAVGAANGHPGTDTVVVPAGAFRLTRAGARENANATGDLDVTSPLVLEGAGADATRIDGLGSDRVVHVPSAGALTVRDLTITGGGLTNACSGSPAEEEGAGIGAASSTVVIERVRLLGNHHSRELCSGNRGGGIAVHGGSSSLSILASEIHGNSAGSNGGGVQHSGSLLIVRDSTISGNDGGYGGGGLTLDVTTVRIVNSTISGNRAGRGGAIEVGGADDVRLHSSTVTANEATGTGGGGAVARNFGTSTVTLRNSILAGNAAFAAPTTNCGNPAEITYASAGYSLVGTDCVLSGGAGNVITDDPQLAAPAALGGLGRVLAPLPGSPAIGAGDPGGCDDYLGTLLSTDQRGAARILGGRCEIGAVEDVPVVPAPPVPAAPVPGPVAAPPVATFPRNTRAPRVAGSARAGRTVRCAVGTWSDAGPRSVAWLANGKALKGARKRTLKLSARLVGRALQCRETVRDGGRSVRADSAPVIVRKALKRR